MVSLFARLGERTANNVLHFVTGADLHAMNERFTPMIDYLDDRVDEAISSTRQQLF